LQYAADLGRALKAEIVLLHVIDYVPTLLPVDLPGGYPLPQIELVNEAAGKKLARIAAKLAPLGILQAYASPEAQAAEIREEFRRVTEMAKKAGLTK